MATPFRSAVRAGPGPTSIGLYRLEGSKNNAFEIIYSKQEYDSPLKHSSARIVSLGAWGAVMGTNCVDHFSSLIVWTWFWRAWDQLQVQALTDLRTISANISISISIAANRLVPAREYSRTQGVCKHFLTFFAVAAQQCSKSAELLLGMICVPLALLMLLSHLTEKELFKKSSLIMKQS